MGRLQHGPNGTNGYVKIVIAKSFMPNSGINVYLDGKETSYLLVLCEKTLKHLAF
jgi:hypothetical protein